jgi:hypothetical protein
MALQISFCRSAPEDADIKLAFGLASSTSHGLIQMGLESQEDPVKYPLSRRTDYRQAGAGTSGRELIRLTDLKTSPARQCAEKDLKPCAGMCGASPRLMPSMSLEWKMCSISMPRRPDPSGLWSASTKSPTQRIGEVRQPISLRLPGRGTIKVKGLRAGKDFTRNQRCSLPQRRQNPCRPGQSVHAFPECALPGVPRPACCADGSSASPHFSHYVSASGLGL